MASGTTKYSALKQFRNEQTVDKMRHNRAPMAEERKRTLQLLQQGEREMEAFDTEINQLHAAIVTIQNQKRELAHHMIRTRSLLTPIRTLPVEVLSEIFRLYVVDAGGNKLGTETNIPANTLSLVCKHWREVALWTRELWSIIQINDKASDQALNTLLSRTAKTTAQSDSQIPLELTLFMDSDYYYGTSDPALENLISQSSRWRSLVVRGWPSVLEETIFKSIAGRLQQLEILVLKPDDAYYPESTAAEDVLSFFQEAPLLRTVDTILSNEFDLPWSQLSTLSFNITKSFSEYVPMLQNLTMVEEVSISFDDSASLDLEEASGPFQVVCQTLRLNFSGLYPNTLLSHLQILSHLGCPKLETLSIVGFVADVVASHPLQRLNDFLLLSQPPLRCLHLESVCVTTLQLHSSLALMPRLEELSINDVKLARVPTVFRVLKVLNKSLLDGMSAFRQFDGHALSSPCLLPRITRATFTVVWDDTFHEDQQAMASMLQSRCIPDTSQTEINALKSVTLRNAGGAFTSTFVQQMRHLRSLGLKVTVQDWTGWPLP